MDRPQTRILKAINRYHTLNILQAGKLAGYSIRGIGKGSYTLVSSYMKSLFTEGFIGYGSLPHEVSQGGDTKLYVITKRGRAALRKLGEPIISTATPFSEDRLVTSATPEKARSAIRKLPEYWRHVMHSNDALIAAQEWIRLAPEIEYRRMLTEVDINKDKKHFPIWIPLTDGTRIGVKPDGLLEVFYPGRGGYRYWFEIEHDNYEESAFRSKVRNLVYFAQGANEEFFGTPVLTYLFFATRGYEHKKRVLKWIYCELQEMEEEDAAEIFRVTDQQPHAISVFTRHIWSKPGYQGDYPLFT